MDWRATAWLGVTLALWPSAASAAVLRLELRSPADEVAPESAIVLRSTETPEPGAELVERRVPWAGESQVEVELPPRSVWSVQVESGGLWAPEAVVMVGAGEAPTVVAFPLWRTRLLTGTVKTKDRAAAVPAVLSNRFDISDESTPGAGSVHGTATCPVSEAGEFHCEAPAARLDVKLSARGFIPHYRWGLDLTETTRSLGTLTLEAGASLVGWIEAEVGRLDPQQVEIELSPWQAVRHDPRLGEQLARTRYVARPNERGFFQLDGLRAGAYLLEARHPDYAATRVFPLDVLPEAEIALQAPVVLRPPLTLTIQLDPPLDWLGTPWAVRVLRGAAGSSSFEVEPTYQGVATTQGSLVLPGQAPGRYSIQVSDARGNVFWSDPAVRIETENDADLYVPLDLVAIVGTVTLGDEPLAAHLAFGGEHGSLHTRVESDEEGAFSGVLPHAGTWQVEVVEGEQGLHTVLRIEVPETGDSPRRVEIRIPDTLVYGTVVDSVGRPVAGATVLAGTGGDSVQVGTDSRGRFEVLGMIPGEMALMARGRTADGVQSSSKVSVTVAEEIPAGPVELRLKKLRELTGQVISERGPVPGAAVVILPPPGVGGFGASSQTDLTGNFRVEVPEAASRFQILVMPPGHALKAFEIDTHYGSSIALRVPMEGGTLELTVPEAGPDFLSERLVLTLEQEGIRLAKGQLYHWAVSHQGRFDRTGFVIPRLAPGYYRACLQGLTGLAEEAPCTGGHLTPGGSLHLEWPERQEDPGA